MDATVSSRIKFVRKTLKLSQRKFSELLSLSSGYIAGVECNAREPNSRLVKLIAAQFGVNEEWLRTGNGEMIVEPGTDEKTARLVGLFNDLPPHYQNVVLGMIDLLGKARREADALLHNR
jgi:transcriptional regulator with XRE-family HTH domain